MAVPENIQLTISLNGDAAQTGAIGADFEDDVVLGLADSSGVKKATYRIWEYPAGFACPAGWTEDASGLGYYVTTTNGADAPEFTLPASTDVNDDGHTLWGRYFFSVEVNDRRRNGTVAQDLFDDSSALYITSGSGIEDVGFLEETQFDALRKWAGSLKRMLREVDVAISAVSPPKRFDGTASSPSGTAAYSLPLPTSSKGYLIKFLIVCKEQTDNIRFVQLAYVQAWHDGSAAQIIGTPSIVLNSAHNSSGATATVEFTVAFTESTTHVTATVTNGSDHTADVNIYATIEQTWDADP